MNIKYEYNERNSSCKGLSFDECYIREVFPNTIYNKLTDIEGTKELIEELRGSIESTNFDSGILMNIFSLEDKLADFQDWRIGEAFAELYLEESYNVRFHYNELRDARNPLGNKTGADLVGFIESEGQTIFVFGEVKTSGDVNKPPQILY